jgi:large subunit ribosomal protein L22
MQAKARSKYIRVSTQKVNRVLGLIRGKRVDQALDILHFTIKSAKTPVEKTIRSAVANLGNFEEGKKLNLDDMFISAAFVSAGPTLKRFRPMSMGRAGRVRKRTSHITIVIEDNK